jgi:hypothetical protein
MKPHIKQFFEFLEKKEDRKIPLMVKISNPRDFKLSPEELNVKGDLILAETPVKELPNNLTVEGDLDISETAIQSLPDNLKVGENLWLNVPLAQKYTIKQIRSMIKKKGGHVNGDIIDN